jgi:hypothetical protein
MTTKISQDEYDLLTFLKSTNHQLQQLVDRFYFYAKKVVKTEDNDWLTDYFNDIINVNDFLKHMDIEVEKKNEKNKI